jgi:hypothetical protein
MEDPGPSSAAAPETPPPPPEEGGGWVVLPPSEVEGFDDPEVVHWEDLQQELARLWSLSAALQAARGRKAHLAARLESAALEVIAKFGSQFGVSPPCSIPLGSPGDLLGGSALNYSWETRETHTISGS